MECYEAYKDSRVEWIGEIPVGWEIKKVEILTICESINMVRSSHCNI